MLQLKFNRVVIVLILLVLTIFALNGCFSSSANYPRTAIVEPSTNSVVEKAVFKPVQSIPSGQKIGSVARFKYDLTMLPPDKNITKVVFKMYAIEKEVLARGLEDKRAGELAPVISPISMLGSDTLKAGYKPLECEASEVSWETSAMSIMSVMGGTGFRATYLLKEPGWDQWDITDLAKEALNGNGELCVAVGDFTTRHPFMSRSIFTSNVLPQKWIYSGSESDFPPEVVAFYE